MSTVLLSAGKATRLGDRAPGGCKALAKVGGRSMLDWWLDFDPALTLVCRSEHVARLPANVESLVNDEGGGPAAALRDVAMQLTFPLTVAYADTWVPALITHNDSWKPARCVPEVRDFCGVAAAVGGRSWDVVEDGVATSRLVRDGDVATVCIGLYRFSDEERLVKSLDVALSLGGGITNETGMASVVNLYGTPFLPVLGWQDVGDPEAIARWRHL